MAQTFGSWITQTRQARGWTIQQCARKAGLRWDAWAHLENDEPRSQSGKLPQRRRDTVVAVAQGLDVDDALAFAAANLRNLVCAQGKSFPEDTLLFDAIARLDIGDKQAMQALVSHLNASRHTAKEMRLDAEAEAQEKLRAATSPAPSHLRKPRTVGIDLDAGYLYDPEGRRIREAQLAHLAERLGQLAAIYVRSHYALGEVDTILAQMRQILQLPDLAPENSEERTLYISDAKA